MNQGSKIEHRAGKVLRIVRYLPSTSMLSHDFRKWMFLSLFLLPMLSFTQTDPPPPTPEEVIDSLIQEGIAKIDSGKFEAALVEFDAALKIDKWSFEGWFYRGYTYNLLGEFKTAIREFDKALKVDYRSPEAYEYRAWAHEELGDYASAVKDYTQAARFNPKERTYYFYRGMDYYLLGDYRSCIDDMRRSLAVSPDSTESYYYLGSAHYLKGNLAKGTTYLTLALERSDTHAYAHTDYGLLLSDESKHTTALEHFNTAIALDSTNTWAWKGRSEARWQLDEKEAACQDLQKAIDLGYPMKKKEFRKRCGEE